MPATSVQITFNVRAEDADTIQRRFDIGEYLDIDASGTENYNRLSFRARLTGLNLPYEHDES